MAIGLTILIFIFIAIVCLAIPVAIGLYVYGDAKQRHMNALLWTLVTVFAPGFIGLIIYLVVRNDHSALICPRCGKSVAMHFTVCPECGYTLNHSCPNCRRPLAYDWNICPHCAQPVPEDMRINSPAKPKADKGIRRLLVIVILVPVILGLLLISAVVFLFMHNPEADTVMAQNVIFEQAEEYGVVSVELGENKNIVTGVDVYFYSADGKALHSTGVSIPGNDDAVFSDPVSVDFPVSQVGDSDYIVVTVSDAYDLVLARSQQIELFDDSGDMLECIELEMINGELV